MALRAFRRTSSQIPSQARLSTLVPQLSKSNTNRKDPTYWDSKENQRSFLLSLTSKLGLPQDDLSSLYQLTIHSLIAQGGRALIARNRNSILLTLTNVFPEHIWDPAMFPNKPRNFWDSPEAQRKYLESLAPQLKATVGDWNSWYKVTVDDIRKSGGHGLLARHGYSLKRVLEAVFPEHKWDPTKFNRRPKDFWKSLENQKRFLEELGQSLGIKKGDFAAWYNVSTMAVSESGGGGLLRIYDSSLYKLLKAVYPEHAWSPTSWSKKQQGYWGAIENQKSFLKDLALKLNIPEGEVEPWYKVTTSDFLKHGGSALLNRYKGSVSAVLLALMPHFSWEISRFAHAPIRSRASREAQKEILLDLGRKLGIKEGDYEKWYRVGAEDFVAHIGWGLLNLYNSSPSMAVMAIFSEHTWKPQRFSYVKQRLRKERADGQLSSE